MLENLRELYQYRALLASLIGRDLKVRYRGSVFGFLWTFLNPLLLMTVYSVVFSFVMRSGIENYTYFMFVGLLPWGWFLTSVLSGTPSISDRRDLISKVKFPPQILPMMVVGSALANYLFTLPLMLCFGLIKHVHYGWPLVVFPLLLVVQTTLNLGVIYITSSINVVFRDLQHILANIMQFLFFLTPVIYTIEQVPERFRPMVRILNPVAILIASYQDIFVFNRWPNFKHLGYLGGVSICLFWIGARFMGARREDFAEIA